MFICSYEKKIYSIYHYVFAYLCACLSSNHVYMNYQLIINMNMLRLILFILFMPSFIFISISIIIKLCSNSLLFNHVHIALQLMQLIVILVFVI